MDRKLFTNYIYNILYQLVKVVMPIIIVPYTMGHLGETTLGISDFASNIASWFILFGTLGANVYGNRQIARVRDNEEDRSRTFFEIITMQIINMSIALFLYVAYTYFFVKENQIIYVLHCLTIISSAFEITWFYYGVEDFKTVSIRNIIIKIVGVGLIMLFVKSPADLWLYVVINSGTDLLGQVIMYAKLREYIHFVRFNVFKGYMKHIGATFTLFVPTIAISVYTLLDQTMLGFLTDDTANVALYKAAQGFVKMFLYFITSIGSVMMPRIANRYEKSNNSDEVNRYLNTTFHLAIFLAIPMMMAMIVVSPYFIPWYLPEQLTIISLIQYSSPIVLFISISNVFGMQYLVPTGHNKEYTTSVIAGAVINCIVNLILIPRYAGVGAAIGSVCAEFAVMFVQFLFVRDKIEIHAFKSFLLYVIASIAMSVAVVMIGNIMGPSFLCNVVQALVGTCIYGLILLVTREQMLVTFIDKFLRRNHE